MVQGTQTEEDKEGEREQANGLSDLGCQVGRGELVHAYQGFVTLAFIKRPRSQF